MTTDREMIEMLCVELERAKRRFELIAIGCSKATADPAVGAYNLADTLKQARAHLATDGWMDIANATMSEVSDAELETLEDLVRRDDWSTRVVGSTARRLIATIRTLRAENERLSAGPAAGTPYLHDRADGVAGHYSIARDTGKGYSEFWHKDHWSSVAQVFPLGGPVGAGEIQEAATPPDTAS